MPFSPTCQNSKPFVITGGQPSGGTYFVDGLPRAEFDPSKFSPGQHSIEYRYTNSSGCTSSATEYIQVNPSFNVNITPSPINYTTPYQPVTLDAAILPQQPCNYKWVHNFIDTVSKNENRFIVQASMAGKWQAIATSSTTGCIVASNIANIMAQPSNNLFVFPNPNNGKFSVSYFSEVIPTEYQLTIYNTRGAKVFTKKYNQYTPYGIMQVSIKIPSGTYIAKLTGTGNKLLSSCIISIQ